MRRSTLRLEETDSWLIEEHQFVAGRAPLAWKLVPPAISGCNTRGVAQRKRAKLVPDLCYLHLYPSQRFVLVPVDGLACNSQETL